MTYYCPIIVVVKVETRPGDRQATHDGCVLAAHTVVKEAIEQFLETPLMKEHRYLFPSGGSIGLVQSSDTLEWIDMISTCRAVLATATRDGLPPAGSALSEIAAAVNPIVKKHETDPAVLLKEGDLSDG